MTWKAFSLGVVVGSVCLALSASAAGPAVPQAVQRAVAQMFGTTAKIEHERENGADAYEVKAPARLEVSLDTTGTVQELEVAIPLGLVPPEVVAAARRALPKDARIVESELVVRKSQLLYEIEGKSGRSEIELILDAGGKVIAQEVEEDDDSEDD